ncbi:potassium:proton antiporter (plasmid) [Legionella adelaidensis]|uniref:Potassium:proton antiporter n=1 Tax=Legionella adelaidensis TaxID=45056 RepID=A0A0W0R5U9_9GAMM|nr:cation:proton antiporter [Legionella adelaidensis]KTC66405.1 potassium:proton antiporter [Legionella adelaidensis]VEH85003.1 potassium:proton antiporter [Legionella adelaidensis]
MQYPVLETILLVLLAVLIVNSIFRFFNLPVILGYLLVGVFVGPYVLALVPNSEVIQALAEFGVVFLMFTIGLDFSFSKLRKLRFAVFVLGSSQVISCIVLTVAVGLILKIPLVQCIVIGCVVSMSSTALVIKQLSEQGEVNSSHGLTAIGILLFQDLAVVPVFIILASLSALDAGSVLYSMTWASLRGILAIGILASVGFWIFIPLFRYLNPTKQDELFTISVLFIAIGSAWITANFGMTLALGAFLSGIFLAETDYSKQIKDEIRPFRDILLGLFFVSIGMLANIKMWGETWVWIMLTLLAILLGKTLLIILLCKMARHQNAVSVRTGIVLAQGGEFGFAILTLALSRKLLSFDYSQVVLAALLISFACAPLLIRYNEKIGSLFARR